MNARELLDVFERHAATPHDQRLLPPPVASEWYVQQMIAALRAVLDLHEPGKQFCWCGMRLPCETVQTIQAALEAE